MNLKGFLRQTVSYERRTGEDDWNYPTFDDPVTLPARVEEKQNLVRAAGGQQVLATTKVMLAQEVQIRDRINGLDVQARESIVDVSGRILGWMAFL